MILWTVIQHLLYFMSSLITTSGTSWCLPCLHILEYRSLQLPYNKLRVSGLGACWQGIPSAPGVPSGLFKQLICIPLMMLIWGKGDGGARVKQLL